MTITNDKAFKLLEYQTVLLYAIINKKQFYPEDKYAEVKDEAIKEYHNNALFNLSVNAMFHGTLSTLEAEVLPK